MGKLFVFQLAAAVTTEANEFDSMTSGLNMTSSGMAADEVTTQSPTMRPTETGTDLATTKMPFPEYCILGFQQYANTLAEG